MWFVKEDGMCLQMAKASLRKEAHQNNDEKLCVVCWDRAREVIFYYCMHMVRSCNSHIAQLPVRCVHGVSCMPKTAVTPDVKYMYICETCCRQVPHTSSAQCMHNLTIYQNGVQVSPIAWNCDYEASMEGCG